MIIHQIKFGVRTAILFLLVMKDATWARDQSITVNSTSTTAKPGSVDGKNAGENELLNNDIPDHASGASEDVAVADDFKENECCSCDAQHRRPQLLSEDVQQLADSFWQWQLQYKPEFATSVGIHDYDHRLTNMSLEAYDKYLADVKGFQVKIDRLEAGLSLPEDVKNIRILKEMLQTYVDGAQFKHYLMSVSNLDNPKKWLLHLLPRMPRRTYAHYTTLLQRLRQVPAQLLQLQHLMEAGAAANISQHQHSVDKIDQDFSAMVVADPRQSPIFVQFFQEFPGTFTQEEIIALQHEAETVIRDNIVPSFEKLRSYMATEYVTREDIAVSSLPNGEMLYAQLIKFYAGVDWAPRVIHEKGLREVERIEGLMQQLVYEMGLNMTLREFIAHLRDDPAQQFSSVEELLSSYRDLVYNITIPASSKLFNELPKTTLKVEEQSDRGGAFYLSGNLDGSRPAIFKIGTRALSAHTKFMMVTLALHEGYPGHHLHISHLQESPLVPYFRSFRASSPYSHAPSSFPTRAYFIEGWALYAESLGFEMGVFDNLLDRFGHYSEEVFRAARLVVDTGLHALGWSRDEAIQFLLDHSARTEASVQQEVDRYITWPGQALSYKIGQMQFSSYRADAEQKLGDKFNLKAFHDVILNNFGPMKMVKEEVEIWVQEQLSKQVEDAE